MNGPNMMQYLVKKWTYYFQKPPYPNLESFQKKQKYALTFAASSDNASNPEKKFFIVSSMLSKIILLF